MSEPIRSDRIKDARIADAISERYLAYAMSTIVSRSLPDVRDGLKPVHRRLLHAMRLLKLDPGSGFKKCARVVGDVIGKYHPHGDQSVYDALVRLAQDFAQRYPLVDGQGNFGNVDGDNAAAMRYTEARLSDVAGLLLDGLDEDSVDFRDTYDGTESEPIVLPAAFPNLLANGGSGIAVGMATSIPPHNVVELITALLHIIKTGKQKTDAIRNTSVTIETVCTLVHGPDFPTGGILVEPASGIVDAYRTGRGSFRLRARWEKEDLGRGQYQIIVHEIPYQVSKARLIEKIAGLIVTRKLPMVTDVRDESTEDIRIVLEIKSRTIDAAVLMEHVFQETDLEVRIPLNLNVLDSANTPQIMNLREVLVAFLMHREEILVRRARHRLGQTERRLEMLGGFLIAYLNLDAIIRLIREEDDPKAIMMARFDLSGVQADAVLNMRLRQLRKLEEIEIRREQTRLSDEKIGIESLLVTDTERWSRITDELRQVRTFFTDKPELSTRRTDIGAPPDLAAVAADVFVDRRPLTAVLSAKGWIRAVRDHLDDTTGLKFKEGDHLAFSVPTDSAARLSIFATNGRFYTLETERLQTGRGHGEPIRLLIDLPNDHDVVAMMAVKPAADQRFVIAADSGRGFIVTAENVIAQTRNGRHVLSLGPGEKARVVVAIARDADSVAVLGENGKLLVFSLANLPEMGRGRGVILQRYRDGGLADITAFNRQAGIGWQTSTGVRVQTNTDSWIGKRGGGGTQKPKGFSAHGRFA